MSLSHLRAVLAVLAVTSLAACAPGHLPTTKPAAATPAPLGHDVLPPTPAPEEPLVDWPEPDPAPAPEPAPMPAPTPPVLNDQFPCPAPVPTDLCDPSAPAPASLVVKLVNDSGAPLDVSIETPDEHGNVWTIFNGTYYIDLHEVPRWVTLSATARGSDESGNLPRYLDTTFTLGCDYTCESVANDPIVLSFEDQ
jgi:hypothetical protein